MITASAKPTIHDLAGDPEVQKLLAAIPRDVSKAPSPSIRKPSFRPKPLPESPLSDLAALAARVELLERKVSCLAKAPYRIASYETDMLRDLEELPEVIDCIDALRRAGRCADVVAARDRAIRFLHAKNYSVRAIALFFNRDISTINFSLRKNQP